MGGKCSDPPLAALRIKRREMTNARFKDMLRQMHHFDLMADYFQFYLQDEGVAGDLSESWTPAAYDRMLAIAPGTLGVGTARNMPVPVDVEIRSDPPSGTFDIWDHVVDAAIEVPSGRIIIAGCTDYRKDAARIIVVPGTYRARIYYGQLDQLSDDGLDGDDHYALELWQGTYIEPVVVKSKSIAHDKK
jgi:hypothetical protein